MYRTKYGNAENRVFSLANGVKWSLEVRLVAAGELTVSHECIVVDNRGHDWA